MIPVTAITYAVQLLSALPQLVQAGVDISETVSNAAGKLRSMQDEKRDPTPAEWTELNTKIAGLRGELHRA